MESIFYNYIGILLWEIGQAHEDVLQVHYVMIWIWHGARSASADFNQKKGCYFFHILKITLFVKVTPKSIAQGLCQKQIDLI